jgi:hypothetical protein
MDNDLDNYSERKFESYYNDEVDQNLLEHYKIITEHKKEFEEEREILLNRLKQLKNNYSHINR